MSRTVRCQLVLMTLGLYSFGRHVVDDWAFVRRCQTVAVLRGRA